MYTHLSVPWLSAAALALMPTGLLLAALARVQPTRHAALNTRQRIRWAAFFALAAALFADCTFLLGARADLTLAEIPLPSLHFSLPLSIAVNGLTLTLATLAAFVIVMIAQYSVQYLDGDPQQARFSRLLASTAGFFLIVVVAGNVGLFTLGIFATGFTLHRLLKFYSERPKAIMAAHKKSIFSRSADLCLLGATVLIGQATGSLQFAALRHSVEHSASLPISLQIAAWLLVAAVILKSALFPFQGWLIQVMEAPTPVSALMHAGVVYSGAIIALRCSALLVRVPDALLFLGAVGLLTVFFASLVMTTQTAIKSALAWSTTAQLGFMSLELGLGLFPLALLHLLGHSLYKAHAFLSSGSVTDQLRQVPAGPKKIPTMGVWMAAVLAGVVIAGGGAWALGENPLADPDWFALVAIVSIALSQLLVKGFGFDNLADRLSALSLALLTGGLYLLLHSLFVWLFRSDLAAPLDDTGLAEQVLVYAVAASFLLLSWLQGPGRALLPQRLQLALYTHLYNGLYVDYWVEQFSHRFWAEKVGVELPRKNLALESLENIARNQEVLENSGGAQ
ncbi:proton-conducting transporter membrane subunit [Acidithiobacillus sp. AMEEHan]|uniref:proton-conducting transporter transmembrane domain-containing protein n=1 Tax=Acidithiobacillus sp. AMEEHan TaxID=2994951 RepID=UPI0027E5B975|nr:proton-conducting transporter membrane subunit [Acidithiobacillus sp. AMEEHan]